MPLNSKQHEAVNCPLSPTLVIAGAGTGKTTVLIERIIYLIKDRGINPDHILAITFTNKAKEEVIERVSKALPDKIPKNIYTFHALFHLILRRDIDKIGRKRNFAIIDSSEQRAIVRRIIKNLKIDYNKPNILVDVIRELKHRNKYEKPLEKNEYSLSISKQIALSFEELSEIYCYYNVQLIEMNALDFDDLEIITKELLKIDDVKNYWSESFKAILIDEFQDINDIQFHNIKQLLLIHKNIFCVGDPDQSIYAFRGAKPNICFEFLNTFENTNLIKLEENYRSTKNILKIANHLINKNSNELSKILFTNNEVGEKIVYKECNTETEEVKWIISEIKKLVKEGAKLKEIAVLYRNNHLSVPFEVEIKGNFDYSISNSVEFYSREEIKYIKSYLYLIFKNGFHQALENIVDKPARGIGERSLATFINYIKDNRLTVNEGLEKLDEIENLNPKAIKGFKEIQKIINELTEDKALRIDNLITKILEKSGYKEHVISKNEEYRIENINQFAAILSSETFLNNEEIVDELSLKTKDMKPKSNDYLILSTVHGVKGLEFKYVFVAKMTNGVFPSSKSLNPNEKEEERRLAYVAFTRAKKRLFISKSPLKRRNGEVRDQESEFISEIKKLEEIEIREADINPLFKKLYFS